MPAAAPALAMSPDQFRLVAENMPVMCWLADATGHIFWYNRRWYEFSGTSPAEMEGWGWQALHDPVTLGEVSSAGRRRSRPVSHLKWSFLFGAPEANTIRF
jgi:PAS domain S-box-containing protein